jgi:6-pyruvoyltetrahydropterin/6-carboxytetrahydropterin synthase
MRVTKEIMFEAAHRLRFHRGACRNVHGHSYRLRVTIEAHYHEGRTANSPDAGMVMDFGDLSVIMRGVIITGQVPECGHTIPYDHALILCEDDPLGLLLEGRGAFENVPEFEFGFRIVKLEVEPTAENMAEIIGREINGHLRGGVEVVRVELWETATSCATWEPEA